MDTDGNNEANWVPGLCKICLEPSTGHHYGAESCEGCKAFYKRALLKDPASFRCYFGGSCRIGPRSAFRCKACRFRKCEVAGMKPPPSVAARSPVKRAASPQPQPSGSRSLVACERTVGRVERPIGSRSSLFIRQWSEPDSTGSSASQFGHIRLSDMLKPNPPETPTTFSQLVTEAFRESITTTCSPKSNLSNIIRANSIFQSRSHSLGELENPSAISVQNPQPSSSSSSSTGVVSRFVDLMSQQNTILEETVGAVVCSALNFFQDEMNENMAFMTRILNGAAPPTQPETSLEQWSTEIKENGKSVVAKSIKFAKTLPGYNLFSDTFQRMNMIEKNFAVYAVLKSPFVWNGELYYLSSTHKYHVCRYWMVRAFGEDFFEFYVLLLEQINRLRLNQAELFMLMAVTLLQPGDSVTTGLQPLLFAHYLDALRYLIGQRNRAIWPDVMRVIKNLKIANVAYMQSIAHYETSKTKMPVLEQRAMPMSECVRMLKQAFRVTA